MTSDMPPASYRSDGGVAAARDMSATIGVRAAIVSNSSSVSGRPNSWAIAEQVEHAVRRAARGGDRGDRVLDRGFGDDVRRPDVVADERHRELAGLARRGVLAGSSAGMPLRPAGDRPRNSMTIDIVFAVYWPPHAPAPGHAALSIVVQLVEADLAGAIGADRLEDRHDRRGRWPLYVPG